jgi:hypothetical protein
VNYQLAIQLVREEGMAARRLRLGDDRNPYPADGGALGDLRGHWAAGWAYENGRLRGRPHEEIK